MAQAIQQPPNPSKWEFKDGDQVASVNSRFAVNMCFTNRTAYTVDVRWLNFDGNEISYGRIEPGETNLLYTYLTHPWVFRQLDNSEELLVVHGKPVAWPTQKQPFADIFEAPFLPWNTATHASTFRSADPAFARDVQNLLMAYYAQRKANSRSCDIAGCRGSAAGKTRRSSAGGALDMDADMLPTRAAVNCCGVQLWHWRGLEGCNALHTAPSHSSHAAVPGSTSTGGAAPPPTQSSPSTPNFTATASAESSAVQWQHHANDNHNPSPSQSRGQPEDGLLGQLPYDIILEIIAKMAPKLRTFLPVLKDDMEMMPSGVEPAKGPVALLASRLLGPMPPPAPVVEADAWFMAVNAGAIAGEPQVWGEMGALLAQDGPLAPPAAPAVAVQQPMQEQVAAGRAPPVAPVELPPQVVEVMRYNEATVLATTALTHAARMALHQQMQGSVLQLHIKALNCAVSAAAAATVQQQQQQGPAAGGGEGGHVPAEALEQGAGGGAAAAVGEAQEDGGSEYGDADSDEDLDEQAGGDGHDNGGGILNEGAAGREDTEASGGVTGNTLSDEDDDERFQDAGDLWSASLSA